MQSYLLLTAIFSCLAYFAAALLQAAQLLGKPLSTRSLRLGMAYLAILLHGYALYHWIDIGFQQNLSNVNLLSLTAWLAALLTLIAMLRQPLDNLLIFISPAAALSIVLVLVFPQVDLIDTGHNLRELCHVILSTLTLSVLCIAALQAVLLAIQERRLHYKPISSLQLLPPIVSMERLLFQIISLGFILLSGLLSSSLLLFQDIFSAYLLHKSMVSLLAWVLFAILILGRQLGGWRGRTAVNWTLAGFALLAIVYFGSHLAWGI